MCTEQLFLKDVATHQMTVLRDDGVNRHVRFSRPGTRCMSFDLVTWPGYLCYTGDMGSYLFRRLEDMFMFFRTEWHDNKRDNQALYIDLSYWAEKLEAIDRSGIKEYRADKFRERIKEWLDDEEASEAVRHAVKDEVLRHADDGAHEAMRAAIEFKHDGFQFSDFWEVDPTEYTNRFVWCCYALAWGIQKYDQEREAKG